MSDYPITADDITRRASEDQTSIFHASRVLHVEGLRSGLIPSDLCVCGGLNFAGWGDHEVCKARIRRGVELRRVSIDDDQCDCYSCSKARGRVPYFLTMESN